MNLMLNIIVNILVAFLFGSLLLGLHRKVMARVQLRPGPPIVQDLIHSIKFFFKETSFPKTATYPLYIGIVVIFSAVWVTGVIEGPVLKGSLLIIFGIYAVHKIVEHNAGSSSGSPYGKLSCVRAVFSAAAELPLFAVLALIFLKTGTLNISSLISYQSIHGPLILSMPLAAIMFLTLILSKAPYNPFCITKAKDLVTGFETEHFGVLRGLIMFTDSVAWYMLLWVFLVVFCGPIGLLGLIIGMIIITVIMGFISAVTPMLNPNHSVMTQISIAIVCTLGTVLMLII
ncbi:respiratory chain complex I subunit 1 family protein [Methanobrevibacter acididurans]|uniref:respiratory chain complex I subunit 1 family protein n=1 Tax=Methanobrevibacter acididurans TaxID=120963 RepID=UPI0038FC10A0